MKKIETIIVHFVQDFIYAEFCGKYAGKFLLHFAGCSDNPKKLMKLQVWEMPFDTREDAQKTILEYRKNLDESKTKTFIIFLNKSKIK